MHKSFVLANVENINILHIEDNMYRKIPLILYCCFCSVLKLLMYRSPGKFFFFAGKIYNGAFRGFFEGVETYLTPKLS